jgi:hypothetical protein
MVSSVLVCRSGQIFGSGLRTPIIDYTRDQFFVLVYNNVAGLGQGTKQLAYSFYKVCDKRLSLGSKILFIEI